MASVSKTVGSLARPTRRFFLMSLGVAPLGGCLGRGAASAVASQQPILHVATTRNLANGGLKSPFLDSTRSSSLLYVRARPLAPDSGALLGSLIGTEGTIGQVEQVPGEADQKLAESLRGRETLFYIHGYNHTFETSARDALALSTGIGFRGNAVLFSWPSRAGLLDYVYDRESALLSRDAMADALSAILNDSYASKVNIVAHSMGTLLLLEGLRTYRDRHGIKGIENVGAIVLASPDIDLDLFKANVARLGAFRDKITVITATNDRALDVSRRLAGGARVGALPAQALAATGLRVVDATEFSSGLVRHDAFLSNDDVRAVIRRAIERA